MNNQQLQDIYKSLINNKNFLGISKLIEKTEIKPNDYLVRLGIKNYLEEQRAIKTRLFYIIKLLEISDANLDANLLQDICMLMLDLGTPNILEFFAKKTRIDNQIYINIKGYIQKTYSNYMQAGKLVEMTKLMEITSITPNENLVLESYRTFLQSGNLISFANLHKRTGIDPDREFILKMMDFYQEKTMTPGVKEEDKQFWEKRIKKLSNLTGISRDDSSS